MANIALDKEDILKSVPKVQLRIFDDRIGFWNPDGLPEGWSVKTLKEKHESMARKSQIARHFF